MATVRPKRRKVEHPCPVVEPGGWGKPCGREELARGVCRKHYERWRKWGDPLRIGAPGARQSVPDELAEAGITARMRNHWAALDVLGIDQDPVTGRYLWNRDTIEVALLVKRLLDAGFPLVIAGQVAQHQVRHGRRRVAVAPGVYVSVERPALTPEEAVM